MFVSYQQSSVYTYVKIIADTQAYNQKGGNKFMWVSGLVIFVTVFSNFHFRFH